jgi:hypothetical protein
MGREGGSVEQETRLEGARVCPYRLLSSICSLNNRSFNFSGFFVRSERSQGHRVTTQHSAARPNRTRAPVHISDLLQQLLHPAVQSAG